MPWYIRLLVFIAEVTYPIFTVPILSDCIFNEQERRGEMKLHLSIANRSGQHLEASSAPLDWCHCLHSLKSWCDVRRQFWLGSILQLQGIGFFIATHMQGIQPLLKWLLTDCLWFSVIITLCGHTSRVDWETLDFPKAGCAPLLWPARNTPLLLMCTSLSEPFLLHESLSRSTTACLAGADFTRVRLSPLNK